MLLNKNKLQLKMFTTGFNNRHINRNRGYYNHDAEKLIAQP